MPAAVRPGAVAALVMNDIGPHIPKEALERIGAYVGTPRTFSTLDDAEAYFRASFVPFAPMVRSDGGGRQRRQGRETRAKGVV